MGDRKRGGRRKGDSEEEAKMSNEAEAIAKFVRFNCPTESTLFQGNEVHYFTGSKAVDTLYESKYGTKAKGEPRFANRIAAADFMQELFDMQLMWRARKLVPKKKEDKEKGGKGDDSTKSPKADAPKTKKDKKKEKEEVQAEETEDDKKKDDEKKEEKDDGKKKKKVKLEVHSVQYFNDASDSYVWVYDPTPFYKKVIGLLMVVGTIVGCLFPLWPMWLRQGIYYLSITGIGFFGVIIAVAILRTILFGVIWLATGGEHKLWIMPNLTEDVGFFESFQPWYTYERASDKKDDKKKKGKKAKDSDAEEEKPEKKEVEDVKVEEKKKPVAAEELIDEEEAEEGMEEGSQEGDDGTGSTGTTGSDEDVTGSQVSDEDGEEQASSVPDSPSDGQPRQRRRPRKADDFVMVSK